MQSPVRQTVIGRLLTAALALSLSAGPAAGVEFRTGEQVVIAADQVIEDDLYVTGDSILVAGRVDGDVVAWGRIVRIDGIVTGDLNAAGQVVIISGEILDDARVAGMTLRLAETARVTDDVFAGGFSFESGPGSTVGGKTGLRGYQALLAGRHAQGLEASLVGLRIDGTVDEQAMVSVESEAGPAWWTRFMQSPEPLPSVEPGLSLGPGARIEGDLVYTSTRPANLDPQATIIGEARHQERAIPSRPRPTWTQRLSTQLRNGLVLFLAGVLAAWWLPNQVRSIGRTLAARPAASLGWGLVSLLALPVASSLFLVLGFALAMAFGLLTLGRGVVISVMVGLIGALVLAALCWLAVSVAAPIVVAQVAGSRLIEGWRRKKEPGRPGKILGLGLGLLVWALLGSLPSVGFLARWVVAVLGLGAIVLWAVGGVAQREKS